VEPRGFEPPTSAVQKRLEGYAVFVSVPQAACLSRILEDRVHGCSSIFAPVTVKTFSEAAPIGA
jgi:hypothetical protein